MSSNCSWALHRRELWFSKLPVTLAHEGSRLTGQPSAASVCRREVWRARLPHHQVVPPRQGRQARRVSAHLHADWRLLAGHVCSFRSPSGPPLPALLQPLRASLYSRGCWAHSLTRCSQQSFSHCCVHPPSVSSYNGGRSADDFLKFINDKASEWAGDAASTARAQRAEPACPCSPRRRTRHHHVGAESTTSATADCC